MRQKIVLELMDGNRQTGELSRPFRPDERSLDVLLDTTRRERIFSLSDVCYIQMIGKPHQLKYSSSSDILEDIETSTGERFRVYVLGKHSYESGFYGYPSNEESSYKRIFFTSHGIRVRQQDRPLGEILEERGLVDHSSVEEVLKEQKELRERRVGEIIASHANVPQEKIDATILDAVKKGERIRVGDILVSAGLVTREQVEESLASQKVGKKKRVGDLLVERGFVTEDQLLNALATKFAMDFIDLRGRIPSKEALTAVSVDLVYKHEILPLEIDANRILIATSQPTEVTIADALRFHTGRRIELVVARPRQIKEAIEKCYPHGQGIEEVAEETRLEDLIGEMRDEDFSTEELTDDSQVTEKDSQIIKLVNKILFDAYERKASDIHFEPGAAQEPLIVRYRIDGVCSIAHKVPGIYKRAIISRLKIISKLDISERRRPQSGKILMRFEKKKLEFRLEITPTVGQHEDAVLRVMSDSKPLPLEKMGFLPHNLDRFMGVLNKPYGIILCVGPTGSGKTTSLHSALGYINTIDRKIWTAEDPVEITQEGLRQVQINPKINFTFQEALRSFLRADPDVIMIGEMRDPETAKIAIEASLTGHLVFSTLHTNSAAETVVRLIEMKMDAVNFSEAILGILAQRLCRRLCDQCKEGFNPTLEEYETVVNAYGAGWFEKHNLPAYSEELRFMRRGGCKACDNSGYSGRIALHELLVGTQEIKRAIRKHALADELRDLAIEGGMTTLRMDGILKIFDGITDLDQVLKVSI